MKFNEDSEEIMKLLLPLYEKKIKKGINKSKLTKSKIKTYTSSLKQMFNNIRISYKNIEHLKKNKDYYEPHLEEITSSKKNLPKPSFFNSTHFLQDEIRRYVVEHTKKFLVYKCKMNSRTIYIYFTLFEEDELFGKYDNYVSLMLTWLDFASKYETKKCAETLSIYIYPTPFKKKLPEHANIVMGTEHINSAVTTSCTKNGEVVVFREEEWFKVFIHETFHILGLDFSAMGSDRISTRVKKLFKIESEMLVFETYAEFWAEIINCMFYSFNILQDKKDFKEFNVLFEYCVGFECIFSAFQVMKILNFMGMSYENLYSEDAKSILMRKYLYKEKTNVFAYYVLKLIVMFNFKEFIVWCKKHNKTLIKFNETNDTLNSLYDFIEEHYDDEQLIELIHSVQDYAVDIHGSRDKSKFILFKTMRMSLCNFA
mgnify:CR=1 FL=1|tara:strand:+ start:1050 stop:2330 length:1281 start_codon:yes stop_codon:yes gene_type:complete